MGIIDQLDAELTGHEKVKDDEEGNKAKEAAEVDHAEQFSAEGGLAASELAT